MMSVHVNYFAPSTRCVEPFKALMKKYSTILNELSSLVLCENGNVSTSFQAKLKETKDAVHYARTQYWFYPSYESVSKVEILFNELHALSPKLDFIPKPKVIEFCHATSELIEETVKFNDLFREECKGAIFLGSAVGFLELFRAKCVATDSVLMKFILKRFKSMTFAFTTYSSAIDSIKSVVQSGICFLGLSPDVAEELAPWVVAILLAGVVGFIALEFYPETCRKVLSDITGFFSQLGVELSNIVLWFQELVKNFPWTEKLLENCGGSILN